MFPTSIAMAATGAGNLKCVNLEKHATFKDLPQDPGEGCRLHLEKTMGLPLFGVITGFFVVFTESKGVLLDRNCDEVENSWRHGRFWPQSVSIQKALKGEV